MMITLLQHIADMSTAAKLLSPFLANRTNGCAYATVLRLSVVVCDVCIVPKRCVLEQKLLLTVYRKSYMRNRLVPKWITLTLGRIKVMPLHCIQRSSSRKPLEIVAWFQRTTNRKWPMGYQVWCEAVGLRSAILGTAWLLIFIFFAVFDVPLCR